MWRLGENERAEKGGLVLAVLSLSQGTRGGLFIPHCVNDKHGKMKEKHQWQEKKPSCHFCDDCFCS